MFSALLDSALRKFETLHHESFRHHVSRRDLYSQYPEQRQVEYDSYGRWVFKNMVNLNSPTLKLYIELNDKNFLMWTIPYTYSAVTQFTIFS